MAAATTATRTETSVVYAAGAVQGIVLVTFPAASAIFTDPNRYDLSNTQYSVRRDLRRAGLLVGPSAALGDPAHPARRREPGVFRCVPAPGNLPATPQNGRASRAGSGCTGVFAVLYGVCETVNGNWSQLDMTSELGASTTGAAIALTAFSAMVTVGRVVFAALDRWLAVRTTYHVLPFLLGAIFVVIA